MWQKRENTANSGGLLGADEAAAYIDRRVYTTLDRVGNVYPRLEKRKMTIRA